MVVLAGEDKTISYQDLQHDIGILLYGRPTSTYRIPKWLAKICAAILNIKDSFIQPWMIEFADDHYELDITRARTMLGWNPKHSLRNNLPKMIGILKSNPLEWYKINGLVPPKKLIKKETKKSSHATAI